MLDDENKTLDSYGVREWMTIRVSTPLRVTVRRVLTICESDSG